MPIYEFRCDICGHVFNELVRNEQQMKQLVCPRCSKRSVKQIPSMVARPRARSKFDGQQVSAPKQTPCGRCGDPNGSCST